MKTLYLRTASGFIALFVFLGLYFGFGLEGLRFSCLMVVLLGSRELIRILFEPEDPLIVKGVFYFFIVAIFILTVRTTEIAILGFAVLSILFLTLVLIYRDQFKRLSDLSAFQAKSVLGFLYMGVLPGFACKLIDLPKGDRWFLILLIIVFFGDITAYLSGMVWGKKLLAPDISPKKTQVGALGGLLGSLVFGVLFGWLLFPSMAWYFFALLGCLVSPIAQIGDLFESMLKRVANKKDSGSLMPGHGGVLDRVDGVVFAAPLVYLAALAAVKLF